MKKLLSISIFLALLPLSFSFALSNETCNIGFKRAADSLAKYGCAMNALAHTYADEFSRFNYNSVIYSNAPGDAVLAKAIVENRIGDAKVALQQGQNPNALIWLATSWCSDSEGVLAPCFHPPIRLLDFAAMVGNVEAIKLLLSSPRIQLNDTPNFSTAIAQATERAQPKALKILLQDPRLRISGPTPPVFHLASASLFDDKSRLADAQDVLRLLLADKRLDPNAREPQVYLYKAVRFQIYDRHREGDTTALMYEALMANPGMIEVLLEDSRVREGMNTLVSNKGKTALAIAVTGSKIVNSKNFLTQAEADEMQRDYDRSVEVLKARGGSKGSIIGRIFN